jgi:hypothetical protein
MGPDKMEEMIGRHQEGEKCYSMLVVTGNLGVML